MFKLLYLWVEFFLSLPPPPPHNTDEGWHITDKEIKVLMKGQSTDGGKNSAKEY